MLLLDRVLRSIEAHPEAIACVSGAERLTYRGFLALLSVVTRHLHGQGIDAGEPVALTMSQSPLHLVVFLALARLGALVVPASPFLRPADRAMVFAKYGIRTAVSDRSDAGVADCRLVFVRSAGARGGEDKLDYSGFVPREDSPMRIALTSGTTGPPKGTLQTQARFVQRLDRMELDVVERPRVIPPNLHITTSITQAMHALCAGGCVVFPEGYETPPFCDAIRAHGVTHVALPPANLAQMLAGLPDGAGFPSIRHLRILGASPSAALLALARRRFSPHVYVPYSLGEIGLVSMADPALLEADPASSGRLLPDVRFEALDASGRVLPRGIAGEVRVAFEGMPTSYYGADAPDRTRFRDGWLHTGDLGCVSTEGLVRIEGRVDEVINMGGRKVSPRFVESVIEEFPGVREAAVFVAGEGVGGTRIAAAVVRAAPLDWRALATFVSARLDVRAPTAYFELEGLPRNSMGKILRAELEKLASGTHFRGETDP
ncbi:MAG: class I adenylate-forming enzyme family protein [Usitatibacter sp.]